MGGGGDGGSELKASEIRPSYRAYDNIYIYIYIYMWLVLV